MKSVIFGAVLGGAALLASTAASAHMDVSVGIGVPGYAYAPAQPVYVEPPPVAYAPPPVAVDYRDADDWRAREWREHERREYWRERQWREREWHDREGDED